MPIVDLPVTDVTTINLIEGIPFFAKIAIADKRPPMTVSLKYISDSDKMGSLSIYGSFKEMRPSATKNQLCKTNSPEHVLVYPKGKIQTAYTYDFYFISMESVGGPLRFTLATHFPVSYNDKSAVAARHEKAKAEQKAARASLVKLAERE